MKDCKPKRKRCRATAWAMILPLFPITLPLDLSAVLYNFRHMDVYLLFQEFKGNRHSYIDQILKIECNSIQPRHAQSRILEVITCFRRQAKFETFSISFSLRYFRRRRGEILRHFPRQQQLITCTDHMNESFYGFDWLAIFRSPETWPGPAFNYVDSL